MRAKDRGVFIRLMVLAAIAALQLHAQGDRGEITGTVMDSSGAVAPAVQITATQTSTNASYKTVSNSAGDFTIPSLPVGVYQVKSEAPGFKVNIVANVAITPGTTARVDIKLEI